MPVKEYCGLRHDEVGLEVLATQRRRVKVWECHLHTGGRINHVGQLWRVTRLVVPCLEMGDLGPTDAQQDPQNLHISYPLREHGIQASSALLDKRKMKSRGIGNGLCEVRNIVGLARIWLYIIIGSRNRRVLSDSQGRDGMRKCISEIRILGPATVACKPTRIYSQLHQIG